ncbi:voltage-gated chloride channel family protein [Terrimonas sp. NA20]|uniref:Voltage-gated chloride channel family protein n=1 Tax=Terrimonas ginsenosidimutans TaxID=2908004 RepID=A0ABS9KMD9_9BACT|nr:voltage-gated chloride channel family protein [Terrimonas ginsenosidimutans]MCG2613466.1 voltage-gated chloride channel family protein [Terrimonas ginsenosidimutans]
MKKNLHNLAYQLLIAKHLFRWTILAIPVSLITGSLVALFLWLLDRVTVIRWEHEWLLYLLPLAGVLIYFIYKPGGRNAEAGNSLIIDEIHQPGAGVPARMTPLVFITTIITHLFGGSAGREGTAVQMGGSMAGMLGRWFKLDHRDKSVLLQCGVAAGFGAVFGTPVTGALFAIEFVRPGRMQYKALLPCFIASMIADLTCSGLGIRHTLYQISPNLASLSTTGSFHVDQLLILRVIIAGVIFGLVGYLFSSLSHLVKDYSQRLIKPGYLRPFIGGVVIICLCFASGTNDYLGLGVTNPDPGGVSIVSAFREGGADHLSWLWKIIFTSITLGMGFKGGEVTPLFFIGATLGNTIAVITGTPVDLMAGLGFIAVFAAATNTPVACVIMGVELFGGEYVLYYAIVCFTAYYFSGPGGIYTSQKKGVSKMYPR